MFFSGYCGIVAELSLFTLAESLIGGTLNNLIATMGVMIFCMGLGSWIAGYNFLQQRQTEKFIALELLISLFTSLSIPCITFWAGLYPAWSIHAFVFMSATIGTFIGLEIPLMQKIMQNNTSEDIQVVSSRVMMADYFGSLCGFVLFPHLLFHLSLPWSTFSSAILNFLIASFFCFQKSSPPWGRLCNLSLLLGFFYYGAHIDRWMTQAEQGLYRHKIIHREQSPYQKIVITDQNAEGAPHYPKAQQQKYRQNFKTLDRQAQGFSPHSGIRELELKEHQRDKHLCLFINGGLQFNSRDEYIYHEHLIEPIFALVPKAQNILVMGAGDGLALREIFKHQQVQRVDLVELDPAMTRFASENPHMLSLNQRSMHDPRLKVIHDDAWTWARHQTPSYDAIVLDFPDPHHIETAKLYSSQFYKLLRYNLRNHGVVITQATSPLYDPKGFRCIGNTLQNAGFDIEAIHVEMRSFGQWGFFVAKPHGGSAQLFNTWSQDHWQNWSLHPSIKSFDKTSFRAALTWPPGFKDSIDRAPINDFLKLPLFQLYEHH